MRLSDVIDDLYDRVLGLQDALLDDDEDDEYEEEDYFPEDEE